MKPEFIVRDDIYNAEIARIETLGDFISFLQSADFMLLFKAVQHHKIRGHFGPWLKAIGEPEFARQLKQFEKMPTEGYVMAAEIIHDNLKGKKPVFSDLVGFEALKELLGDIAIYPEKNPELAKRYGRESNGGVLFYGPPGCGKTYLASALAGETSKFFVKRSIAMLLREGPEEMHGLFRVLKTLGGGIVLLDDIELLAMKREGGHSAPFTNAFLSELDSVENAQILTIGSTNYPWEIDQAVIRSGRLGTVAYVGVPDEKMRAKLFEFYTKGLPLGSIDFEALAGKCDFYSCSDIKAICSVAASVPWKEALAGKESRELKMEDFEEAGRKVYSTSVAWFENALDIDCPDSVIGRYKEMFNEIERYGEFRGVFGEKCNEYR